MSADMATVPAWKLRRAAQVLDRDGDEHGVAADLWMLLADATPAVQPPADPMFWVRLRSDGMYEGPIHNAQIERVRRESGAWSPLYLGAAPAVQPASHSKAERVHALVNDGPFPGMSEAFDAHVGPTAWVDPAYRQDAALWAAAWKAAKKEQPAEAVAPEVDLPERVIDWIATSARLQCDSQAAVYRFANELKDEVIARLPTHCFATPTAAPSAQPVAVPSNLLKAARRMESAFDWFVGRSAFTQTKHLKGVEHSSRVRKEVYAAHDELRSALAAAPSAPRPSGHCTKDNGCMCGGDTDAVRATCRHWETEMKGDAA